MDAALVGAAVDELRSLITADGGDVEVVSLDASTGQVSLRLILEDAHCRECVMPREFLEPIALDMLTGAEPAVSAVAIDDPRLAG